jgi:hypothetical protein
MGEHAAQIGADAREMAQMIPLSGIDIYEEIRRCNSWVLDFLPNAIGPPERVDMPEPGRRARRVSEALLRTPVGDRLETWEMTRKIRKLSKEMPAGGEVAFSADWCKGHFDEHGKQTLDAYAQRLRVVEDLLQ